MYEENGHRPEVGQLVRRDFAGTSVSRDSAATQALVAKARADIEARWTMALHRPRNMDQVRSTLLKECRRPGFAESAIYRKPVGDGVEGLSIRFAEAAARAFGNIAMEVSQIYDDETTRVMRVSATDLESNVTWPMDVTITKVVERRELRRGQTAIARRTNSFGATVYMVQASDDELLNKQGALVSKALRTSILRIIPGNLQDEAYEVCNAILADKSAKDPDAARNAVCDAFSSLNVSPTDLEGWLGHDLAVATPAEIERLRRLYVAVRDGEISWPEALDAQRETNRRPQAKPEENRTEGHAQSSTSPPPAREGKGTRAVKDRMRSSMLKPLAPSGSGELNDDPVTT